jgi:thiol-disulfide isomerase/thioredoxin
VEALAGRALPEQRRPAFAVQTRDGRWLTADSLRGRVVLVNVWATWCPPCRAEMPAMQQLADAYAKDGLVVLGFSVDQGPAAGVDAFLRERGISYPNAIITHDVLMPFGGVRGYPTSFLLDREGILRHAVLGPVGVLTLRPAIARLTGR